MESVCRRCALRFSRTTQPNGLETSKRAFSFTANTRRSLPTFVESSNSELNDVLATLRDKHFIPAALRKQQRKLIFAKKFKQSLQDNPQTATIGGVEVPLQWIDRRRDIPNRTHLAHNAVNLMSSGSAQDWQNLPPLLIALNELGKNAVDRKFKERALRKALETGNFSAVLQCLLQPLRTGMTLREEMVFRLTVAGLREVASKDGFSKTSMALALRDANVIAQLLESGKHGVGGLLTEEDSRTRPEILGIFLELTAVYSFKYGDGADDDNLVKTYAERLLSRIGGRSIESISIADKGPQWAFILSVPIWNGLVVARRILGSKMPESRAADDAIAGYGAALEKAAEQIEAKTSSPESSNSRALLLWRSCVES